MPLAFSQSLAAEDQWIVSGDRAIKEQVEKGKLVLFEPDVNVRDALTLLLQGKGWLVLQVSTCDELRVAIEQNGLTAAISESTLPDCAPEEILELCSSHDVPVVFTGHDLPLQGAVDLIRQGATDFLDKPFPQSRLLDLLDRLDSRQNG